ncbi:MAG: glycosyltransferase family A protein [Verrucomicrobiota bacterium]
MSTTPETFPASAIIPTRHRGNVLRRTLESVANQSSCPTEIIVVDASLDSYTKEICRELAETLALYRSHCHLHYQAAQQPGAASQRNEGVASASGECILFMDDDIILEPECLRRLWVALNSDPQIGGVSAMITNQKYHPPGPVSKRLFAWLNNGHAENYAGKCIGPALAQLPDDDPSLPDVVPVEWLNTTCTLYRRQALPSPPFESHFHGASIAEDLTLSLIVGKGWRLANARTARIYHDSQQGDHKKSLVTISAMTTINRHFIMRHILAKDSFADYANLCLVEVFSLASCLSSWAAFKTLPALAWGKMVGAYKVVAGNYAPLDSGLKRTK